MVEENNELPESKSSGFSLNTIIVAAIVIVVLIIIWAFYSKRLP